MLSNISIEIFIPFKDIGGTAGLVFGLNVLIAVDFIRYWIGRVVAKVNSRIRRFRFKREQLRENKAENLPSHIEPVHYGFLNHQQNLSTKQSTR